jgi:hypothetical protein
MSHALYSSMAAKICKESDKSAHRQQLIIIMNNDAIDEEIYV